MQALLVRVLDGKGGLEYAVIYILNKCSKIEQKFEQLYIMRRLMGVWLNLT